MQLTDIKLEGGPGTDLALVRDAKQGSMAAFEMLIEHHTDKLFRIAFRITKCHEDAEEVVQDAFIKAFNKLHAFEERSRFSTWLTRIAINTALELLRVRPPVHDLIRDYVGGGFILSQGNCLGTGRYHGPSSTAGAS